MEFAILGPVEARDGGHELPIGGPRQRAVLAILLLNANQPVSRDRLIDGVWGESPPPSAGHTLEDYVSRLRKALGKDRIESRSSGYAIDVQPDELDLERFDALLDRGRAAAADGESAEAKELLGEALDLWRGPALADLEYEPFASGAAERLEGRRLLALETKIDSELALGAGSELVGELERLVADHPFRERFLGQLMLSLYRAGRQADALGAYQAGRRRLAEELGLEPGPELRRLERRILEHDPTLEGSAASPEVVAQPRIRRVRILAAAVALAAVAAAVSAGIELGTGGSSASTATRLRPTAGVSELGPGPFVVARGSLEDAPAAMAAHGGSIWVSEPGAGAVQRVDRQSGRVVGRVQVGGTPSALAVGGGAVWAASIPGASIARIDPATETVTQTVPLGGARVSALAFGLGHLWVADGTGDSLLEFDVTGALRRTLRLDIHPTALELGGGAIWVAGLGESGDGLLERIDPRSGTRIPTRVGGGPVAIAVGDGAVWVANSLDSTVSKVDPRSSTPASPIPVGSDPVSLSIDGGSIAAGSEYSSNVSLIDARSGIVSRTISVGGGPTALVHANGRLWIGTRPLAAHHGGTLVLLHTNPLSLDPALQGDLPGIQSNGLTYDTLLASPHTAGVQALLLIPDLAISVPIPTDQGMTYTFRLRPGIRYSDGRFVRASDFRRAIERLLRLQGPWSGNYMSIVGATACDSLQCDLSQGIVTDDAAQTITFHLLAPNADFLSTMTCCATAPAPPGTPFHDIGARPIPATGPYMVASANKHEIRYVRNPRFREWNHAAQPDGNPDQIVMRYGLTAAQEVRAVERDQADWTPDGIPVALQRAVTTRFPSQLHRLPGATQLDAFLLNTHLPPFDNIDARKALNLAIDRRVIARMVGGPAWATTTCQLLPPGMPGYRRYCPYTLDPRTGGRWTAPDLTLARHLIAASGTRGDRVTVWAGTDEGLLATAFVPYTVRVLRELGYRARARVAPKSYFDEHPAVFDKIQLIPIGQANGTPLDYLRTFACTDRWFCDPRLDGTMQEAATVEGTNPRAAGHLLSRIDRELVDSAAALPLVNPYWFDFVSAHIRNYQADPVLGLIADQVSLR